MYMLANAGTPLIWAEWLHFFVGNPLVGLLEGLIIAWLLKRPKTRLVFSLILGNYLSAILGRTALLPLARLWMEPSAPWSSALWGWPLVAMPFVVAFVLSIVVEWPFTYLGIRGSKPRRLRLLGTTALAQCVTYPLVALWLGSVSVTGMVTKTTLDSSLVKEMPAGTQVYFVAPSADEVLLLNPATRATTRIAAAHVGQFSEETARLVVCRGPGTWQFDVWLVHGDRSAEPGDFTTKIASDILRPATPPWGRAYWWNSAGTKPVCLRGGAYYLPWAGRPEVFQGSWAPEGLLVRFKDRPSLHFAMATPFARWYPKHVTVLPGNLLIFGMAEHIWLLHPESGRIAVLAKGRSPVVRWRPGKLLF